MIQRRDRGMRILKLFENIRKARCGKRAAREVFLWLLHVLTVFCVFAVCGFSAQAADVLELIPEQAADRYQNDLFGFSLRWPAGWVKMPNYRTSMFLLEINFARTTLEVVPCLLLAAGERCSGGGKGGDAEILANTANFMEEMFALEVFANNEMSVLQGPRMTTAGGYPAGTFTLNFDRLSMPGKQGFFSDVKLVGYLFMLRGERFLAFSFYVHNDERFAEEWRGIEGLLNSLIIQPEGS